MKSFLYEKYAPEKWLMHNWWAKKKLRPKSWEISNTLPRTSLADSLQAKEGEQRDSSSEFEIPPRSFSQSLCQKGMLPENDSEKISSRRLSNKKSWKWTETLIVVTDLKLTRKQMRLLKNTLYVFCDYTFTENFTIWLR